jgi:PIN domain nuclease of toxin-antitoxin system
LGKLDIKGFSPEDLPGFAAQSGFTTLPLLAAESASYHQLQSFNNHKDPFDGMLIWQAVKQGITLISKDATMEQYKSIGLRLLW